MTWSQLVYLAKRYSGRRLAFPVFYNVNAADESTLAKRALLVYRARPFQLANDAAEYLTHQNLQQCRQIAAMLGECGYVVDVLDFKDRGMRPNRNYDLVLKDRLAMEHCSHASREAKRLLLASTMNHAVHNANLRRRHQRLSQRRGRQLQIRRLANENMRYAAEADAIIGFGNTYTVGTWQSASKGKLYTFNNYGFAGTRFIFEEKDFRAARRNFLFFASGSQVQKGLDLLLEIFARLPQLNLYICSSFKNESDFCECYQKELFETSNIHAIGWVQANTPEFYDLAARCAYVIHPSCSEGQPGSVVQCMHTGLLPLVTREAGIDTEDFGVTFEDDDLERIEKVITELAALPETWHRERSVRTRDAAEKSYTEDSFLSRWRAILSEVLADGT